MRRIDGEGEAHLVALACSVVPTGHQHWTIGLLADKLVELGYVERVEREKVRKVLTKRIEARSVLLECQSQPWHRDSPGLPPEAHPCRAKIVSSWVTYVSIHLIE